MTCWGSNSRKGVPYTSSQIKMGKEVGESSPPTIIPGKLADESKLGGINNLIHHPYSIQMPLNAIPIKKRYRQDFGLCIEPPKINNASQENVNHVVVVKEPVVKTELTPPKPKEVEPLRKTDLENNNYRKPEKSITKSQTVEKEPETRKKDRACKGVRYRHFMAQTLFTSKSRELNKLKVPTKTKSKYHLRNSSSAKLRQVAKTTGQLNSTKPNQDSNEAKKMEVSDTTQTTNHLSLLAEAALNKEGFC